ncbi:peptidoglycan-binding protein [Nocardiopsis sp. CNT312]|uniref:peptidoglycan-binding domain-containing protein n=1 Tax=Nocardiopsis sp. CNT312 TaxID=1137268 RepID=UPI00048BA4E3|nr:peptidoglycan-binding protein [Nocardiopsis sp. CNT312]
MSTRTRTRLPGRLAALVTAALLALAATMVGLSSASAAPQPAAPVPASGGEAWPEYGDGDADVDVAAAKLLLIQIGFDPHMDYDRPIYFDGHMSHSVRAYQEYAGIPETSRLDADTWEALSDDTFGLYRRGSRGEAVEAIQRLLNAKYALHLFTDGIYGPNTEAAVRSAQGDLGIGVDGIAGPVTFRALITYQDYDR